MPQNRFALCGVGLDKDIVKAVQRFVLRHRFVIYFSFVFLLLLFCTACRLAPIEALPQTPQWALPLDPTSPLAPGLTVRFIARFARWGLLLCVGVLLGLALPFLTPHSSFLIPHLALCYTFILRYSPGVIFSYRLNTTEK